MYVLREAYEVRIIKITRILSDIQNIFFKTQIHLFLCQLKILR